MKCATSLSLVVIKSRQVEGLRKFYSSLGIDLEEERHGSGPTHYAGQIGNTVFEIYPLPEDGTPIDITTRLGFGVDQLHEVVENLQSLGVTIITKPRATKWGHRAVVLDPEGRAVELSQH